MTPAAFNILIILSMFVIGYFIGREKRINKYLNEVEQLRADKRYWVDMCKRQKGEPDKTEYKFKKEDN